MDITDRLIEALTMAPTEEDMQSIRDAIDAIERLRAQLDAAGEQLSTIHLNLLRLGLPTCEGTSTYERIMCALEGIPELQRQLEAAEERERKLREDLRTATHHWQVSLDGDWTEKGLDVSQRIVDEILDRWPDLFEEVNDGE